MTDNLSAMKKKAYIHVQFGFVSFIMFCEYN